MLSSIIARIKASVATTGAVRQLRKLPAVSFGRLLIRKHWIEGHEVIKDFPPEFVKKQAEAMMEEIVKIAFNSDPRMANREKLCDWVYDTARFQVLVITLHLPMTRLAYVVNSE